MPIDMKKNVEGLHILSVRLGQLQGFHRPSIYTQTLTVSRNRERSGNSAKVSLCHVRGTLISRLFKKIKVNHISEGERRNHLLFDYCDGENSISYPRVWYIVD